MSIKRRLFSLVAATAVATTTVALAGVGTAHAAPGDVLGPLTMTPSSGNQASLIDFTTASGVKCPANTGAVQVIITGQTLTEDNPGIITGNTDYSLAQGPSNNVRVPGGVTMASVFSDNGITSPSGDYTFNLQCIDADSFAETGRFTVLTHWTATGGSFNGTYVAEAPAVATSTVLSGPTTSVAGDNVAITAAVTPSDATGSVQFKDGGVDLGAPVAVAGGTATYNSSSLAAGPHAFTAEFIPSGSFTASSSNTLNHTVSTVATTTTLVSNGPTAQFAAANFTATVSPATAGTVTFKEGAATLGAAPVSGGVAAFSTTSLSVGTHAVTAEFVPADAGQADPSTSNTVNHVVDAFTGASLAQTVTVTVPAGALTIVLDDVTGADGVVDLGTAVMDAAGEKLTASGEMDIVKITDTRAGDPGWVASGVVTNFANGTDEINGANLGWVPSVVSLSPNQQAAFAPGATAAAGFEMVPSATPPAGVGLKSSKTLGTAPDDSGNGTARLGAHLDLNIPTDVSAGLYSATLTLTVI